MTLQEEVIVSLARALDRAAVAFMLIGGHANAVWGSPRATLDVDVTVWATEHDAARLVTTLAPDFTSLTAEPESFVRETRVLPLRSRDGVRVDMIFGLLPFEQEAIARARPILIGGVLVPVISPEDLIVMKIISQRPRDAGDVQGIITARLAELDLDYLEPRLRALAEALESPDIMERWERWTTAARGKLR
jgi:hypothetical protein